MAKSETSIVLAFFAKKAPVLETFKDAPVKFRLAIFAVFKSLNKDSSNLKLDIL